jgi:hypothetical protein
VTSSNPFVGLSLVCGLVFPLVYFFYRNHGTKTFSFDNDGLIIDNSKIKIKTRTSGTLSIGHRKKFEKKDDFEKFLRVFELRTQNLATSGVVIRKIPSVWDRPIGKVYGYVIIGLLVTLGIGIFTFKHPDKALVYFLILGGLSTPILYRVFR